MAISDPILKIDQLGKCFHRTRGKRSRGHDAVWAVRDVSMAIYRGECLAVVGESGSGKTTLARCLVRAMKAEQGTIYYNDVDVSSLAGRELAAYRKKIQLISQNHYEALNPKMSIADALAEPLLAREPQPADITAELHRLLALVDLPEELLLRRPKQLSGGQRQRVVIARALAVRPQCIIADEPTANLDVRLKRKVLDLFRSLQSSLSLTLIMITHDISAALYLADRIAVMRHGQVIETIRSDEFTMGWHHPYSRSLLGASLPVKLANMEGK